MKNLFLKGSVALSSLVATSSFAAGTANTAITSAVTAATDVISTDGSSAIIAIGGAMLALAGIAVVFKWAKGGMF